MVELPNLFFLFTFDKEEDLTHARLGSPWTVAGQRLTVTNWVPNFDPEDAVIASIPIWEPLPGLPIEYWTEECLKRIVEPVDQFIFMDNNTKSQGRLAGKAIYAKVLVEMDLSKKPLKAIKLQSPKGLHLQRIEYLNLPALGPKCERPNIQPPQCVFCPQL